MTPARLELLEKLREENPDAMLADRLDEAFVGIVRRFGQEALAAYDYDKCIEIIMGDTLDYEGAVDYFEFNVIGAWVGDGTPVFVKLAKDDDSRRSIPLA
jgi:hypothetical protein